MTRYRAVVDVRISFVHGGGLSAEGFRLDVPRRSEPHAPERLRTILRRPVEPRDSVLP